MERVVTCKPQIFFIVTTILAMNSAVSIVNLYHISISNKVSKGSRRIQLTETSLKWNGAFHSTPRLIATSDDSRFTSIARGTFMAVIYQNIHQSDFVSPYGLNQKPETRHHLAHIISFHIWGYLVLWNSWVKGQYDKEFWCEVRHWKTSGVGFTVSEIEWFVETD